MRGERDRNRTGADAKALEDLRLARKARGDPRTAETLLARLSGIVRHGVSMIVGLDQDAEDLTSLCLIEILENLHRFRGEGPLEAWAGQVTYRTIMRQMKRRRRTERTVIPTAEEMGVEPSNPEREARASLTRARLAAHMMRLPIERRATLVLRLVYGHSVAEVAEMTGVPLNTARDRIRVGLKELRQSLSRDRAMRDLTSGDSDV